MKCPYNSAPEGSSCNLNNNCKYPACLEPTRIRKFNGGAGAILCNSCHVIVKEGFSDNPFKPGTITKEDWESDEPLYCEKCKRCLN